MAVTISTIIDSEVFSSTPETYTVTNEGYVYDKGKGVGFDLGGTGIFSLTINGIVDSEAGGINLYGTPASGASKVVVGVNGQVNSSLGHSLDAAHATNLTNSGVMVSDLGVRIAGGATSFTVINSGIISSNSGTALLLTGKAAAIHTITNNETIYGIIDASGSDGADKLTSNGLIDGDVMLGDGANYFISKGYVNGNILTGIGIDTFLNYNIVDGSIDLGGGADIMTNNKTIYGSVSLGIGNDKFTNAGEVFTKGTISMGADDDIFLSGKYADRVMDEDGKDSYDLGDGLDYFDAVNLDPGVDTGSASVTAMKYDIDTIQGGAQTGADLKQGTDSIFGDIYDASDAAEGISLNLDSVIRTDLHDTKSTTKYAAYTGFSSEIGTDIIKGFEDIQLGSGADLVFGTALADKIDAGDGADRVYGGKGNDYLLGGIGGDVLIGEAGRDTLEGGADEDTFVYRAIADSTLAFAGRDTIMDFSDSNDVIDVSFILGATAFTFTGENVNFDGGTTPEIRALRTTFGWTLQFDSTGDNKADMAIDVIDAAHAIIWTGGDFIL